MEEKASLIPSRPAFFCFLLGWLGMRLGKGLSTGNTLNSARYFHQEGVKEFAITGSN